MRKLVSEAMHVKRFKEACNDAISKRSELRCQNILLSDISMLPIDLLLDLSAVI